MPVFDLEAVRKGQKQMADISTKDTSASTKATRAGKVGSVNMPLATNATTHTPTLKEVAQKLVALELDLAELKAAGLRWHLTAYPASTGRSDMMIFLYHPEYSLGVDVLGNNNLVALINNEKAAAVATRKDVK